MGGIGRRRKGATVTEYGLIFGLIAVVVIGAMAAMGGSLADIFGNAGDCLAGNTCEIEITPVAGEPAPTVDPSPIPPLRDAALSSGVLSAPVRIAGFDKPITLQVAGAELLIDGKTARTPMQINGPTVLQLRTVTAATPETETRPALIAGASVLRWSVTTGDLDPDLPAALDPLLDRPPGELAASDPFQIAGFSLPLQLSVDNVAEAALSLNGTDWSQGPVTLAAGQGFRLRQRVPAATDGSCSADATVTLGGKTATWHACTVDSTPDFFIPPLTDAVPGSAVDSQVFAVTDMRAEAAAQVSVIAGGGSDLPTLALSRDGGATWQALALPGAVPPDASLRLSWTAGSIADGSARMARLSIGGVERDWTVTTQDATPDDFVFTDKDGAELGQTVAADTVLRNFSSPASASVAGEGSPQIALSAEGPWSGSLTVPAAASAELWVRLTAAMAEGEPRTATVSVGAAQPASFTVTTGRTTPNGFAFDPIANAAGGSLQTSNSVTLSGMTVAAPYVLSATGSGAAPVLIANGTVLGAEDRIAPNASVQLQMPAAAGADGAARIASLTVGAGQPVAWSVTTEDTTADSFAIPPQDNVAIDVPVASATVTLAGLSRSTAITVSGEGSPSIELLQSVGGTPTWVPGSVIGEGGSFHVAWRSAAADATARTARVTVGAGQPVDFTVTTGNRVPAALAAIPDTLDVPAGEWRFSPVLSLSGMTLPADAVTLLPEEDWLRIAVLNAGDPVPTAVPAPGRPTAVPANARLVLAMQSPPGLGGEERVASLQVQGRSTSWRMTNTDSTPDAGTLAFAEVTGQPANTTVLSNVAVLTGMRSSAALVVGNSGGFTPEIAINGTWATSIPATVPPDATLQLRLVTGAVENGLPRSVTVQVGEVTAGWDVYTRDTRPDSFDIADANDRPLATLVESTPIQITGIDAAAPISIAGATAPEYRVGAAAGLGTWTTAPGSVGNGQFVQLRLTSAAAQATAVSATVTVGGISDTWTVRTGTRTPAGFAFADTPNAVGGASTDSATVTLSGMTIEAPYTLAATGSGALQLSVNGGGWSSAASGTLPPNASVALRMAAAAGSAGDSRTATLSVAGISGSWKLTTQDSTPNAFGWTSMAGQTESEVVTASDTVTVAGIGWPAPISISGSGSPQYQINGGSWTSAAGTVNNGAVIAVRLTAAPAALTDRTATVTVGGVAGSFTVRTQGSDPEPDAFVIPAKPPVDPGSTIVSDAVVPQNFDAPATIGFSGTVQGSARISIANGAWVSSGRIYPGQGFRVQIVAATYSGSVANTVFIGGQSNTWTVTTRPYDNVPDSFTFAAVAGQQANTGVPSAEYTLAGFNDQTAITVSGSGNPQVSVNGGAWTTSATANPNDRLRILLTTGQADGSSLQGSAVFASGASSASFSVTTVDAMPSNNWNGTTAFENMDFICCYIAAMQPLAGANVPVRYNGATVSPAIAGINTSAYFNGSFRGPGELIAVGEQFAPSIEVINAPAGASGTVTYDFGGTKIPIHFSLQAGTPNLAHRITVTDRANVTPGTTVTSDWITIDGNRQAAPASITAGGLMQVTNESGAWSSSTSVPPNGRFRVQITAPASFNTAIASVVTVGNMSDEWNISTAPEDRVVDTPVKLRDSGQNLNGWEFTGQQAGGHGGTSAFVTPTGYNTCLPIFSTGGGGNFLISSRNGDWDHGWTNSATICPGQSFVFAFLPPSVPGDRVTQTFYIDGLNIGTIGYTLDPSLAGTPTIPAFTDLTGQAGNTLIPSNTVTLGGSSQYAMRATLSGDASAQMSIAGGSWGTTGTVAPGQTIQLRLTSGPADGSSRSAHLVIAGVARDWTVSTANTTPQAFGFADAVEQDPGAFLGSSTATLQGFANPAPVTISGSGSPAFSLSGGGLRTTGTATPGQTLQLFASAPAGYGTSQTVTVTVGGRSANWVIATRASDTVPAPFTVEEKTGEALNSLTTSRSVTPKAYLDPAPIAVTGDGTPLLSIAGGAPVASGTILPGQSFTVQLTSAPTPNMPRAATVTVGGVSATFTVTTGNGGS